MAATEIAWSGLTWRLHPDHRLQPTKMCQDHLGGAFRECDNMYVLQHQMVILFVILKGHQPINNVFNILLSTMFVFTSVMYP